MWSLLRRVSAWSRRGRLDDDLREEVELHIGMRRDQLIDDGMDPDDAESAARRSFGNATRFREETRDMWSFPSLDSLLHDLRYGARLLRRAPGFTAVAVLSLGTGIGATAAVFNVADAVLFRQLAVRAPHELVEFRATARLGAATKQVGSVAESALAAMQRGADVGDLVGFRSLDAITFVGGAAQSKAVRVEVVSPNYFDVLGVVPSAGRLLGSNDTGAAPVPVVLSERLWRAAFGADPHVSGRAATVDGVPAVIIGVSHDFRGLTADRPADVFIPLASTASVHPVSAGTGVRMVVRLHPGISNAVAAQKIAALFKAVGGSTMLRDSELHVSLPPAGLGVSAAREPLTRPLLIGLALVVVLLFVACANTGGLLLVRFASRQTEFAIRIAIGAGRARLIRQLIVESLLLAAIAACAGLFIARITAPLLLRSIPVGAVPPGFEVRFDWRLLAFTTVLASAAALITGGASLFRLVRSDPSGMPGMNVRTAVPGRRRVTEALIVVQVACSLLLLVASWSMTRTLINLHRVDPGFDPTGVFAVSVDAAGRTADSAALPAYYSQLLDRIAGAPHVAAASLAQIGFMTSGATTGTVDIPGRDQSADEDRWVRVFFVGPRFAETLGIRVIAGRSLGAPDAAGRERVAVVNQEFARFYFGSAGDAVGRTFNQNVRIVGVIGDARYNTLRDEPVRAMFVPHTQGPPRTTMTLVVRAASDPALAATSVRAAIRQHDPALKVNVVPIADQIAATLARERFVAQLASILAGLALFLSCAGLYAAVAYGVSARRPELAVRLALGATGQDIVRLVLRDPLRATLIGLILGIPGAYAIMRATAALLFGVNPSGITSVAVCGLALLAIAVGAALWAARRAAAIDPQECLKST